MPDIINEANTKNIFKIAKSYFSKTEKGNVAEPEDRQLFARAGAHKTRPAPQHWNIL
jgi:hypothetical protein